MDDTQKIMLALLKSYQASCSKTCKHLVEVTDKFIETYEAETNKEFDDLYGANFGLVNAKSIDVQLAFEDLLSEIDKLISKTAEEEDN